MKFKIFSRDNIPDISIKLTETGEGVRLSVVNPITGEAEPGGHILMIDETGLTLFSGIKSMPGVPCDKNGRIKINKR